MTRMAGPDCTVMCNEHTHPLTRVSEIVADERFTVLGKKGVIVRTWVRFLVYFLHDLFYFPAISVFLVHIFFRSLAAFFLGTFTYIIVFLFFRPCSRFGLIWFRLSCDHDWIRSGSINLR